LEGIVAKRRNSLHESGRRPGAWQKLCLTHAQEFVVGGFTAGNSGIDSLLIGFYIGRALQLCASVRAGFVPASRRGLYSRLQPLVTDRCPFVNVPETSPGRWAKVLQRRK
jgi:ATP-dependent DNA ligase